MAFRYKVCLQLLRMLTALVKEEEEDQTKQTVLRALPRNEYNEA